MRISSSRATVVRNCHAVSPLLWSKRKSSGPSASGLNPRWASSNCGDEMPRSNSAAEMPLCLPAPAPAPPLLSLVASTLSIAENGEWCTSTRASDACSSFAAAIASVSMSNTCTLAFFERAPSIPRVCPPRPNVASTTTPSGSGSTRLAITSLSIAGVCVPAACSVGRKPECIALAAEICKWRPPNAHPFHDTASRIAGSFANVIQPTPLQLPAAVFMSRGCPTILPASAK
mmetsp:Transcript_54893/g.126397  ORF Transcript_54893/g.126397 Transcript_54893/m.126397 type:complete len:231 (-) Transcript_54893:109-801(-)